jgi:LemA protein
MARFVIAASRLVAIVEAECGKPMKKLAIGCGVLVVLGLIGLILVGIAGGSYNHLVKLQQQVNTQWAQVQNVYQRRADLVPNLVATVSGAANFEKSTLTEITSARASVGQVKLDPNSAPTDPSKLAEFDRAQSQLSGALSRLLVVVERYPNLKGTQNFQDLPVQLEGTENRISVERRNFNEAVQAYDTAIKSFPAVFYSAMLGFKDRPYFTSTPGAETPPKVQFDFGKQAAAPAPEKP